MYVVNNFLPEYSALIQTSWSFFFLVMYALIHKTFISMSNEHENTLSFLIKKKQIKLSYIKNCITGQSEDWYFDIMKFCFADKLVKYL